MPATLQRRPVDNSGKRKQTCDTRAMAASPGDAPRFLTLPEVAEVLNTSVSQVYALVRKRELVALQIGGRRQYRVERDKLEDYIQRMYRETSEYLEQHPFTPAEADDLS